MQLCYKYSMIESQAVSNAHHYQALLQQFKQQVNSLKFQPSSSKAICKLLQRAKILKNENIYSYIVIKLQQLNINYYYEQNYLITYAVKTLKKEDEGNKIMKVKRKSSDQHINDYLNKMALQNHIQQTQLNDQQESEAYLLNLSKGLFFPKLNCIGCLTTINNSFIYPKTNCQAYLIVKYDSNSFSEEILQAFCSILNSGGGYIIIKIKSSNKNYLEKVANELNSEINKNISWRKKIAWEIDYLKYDQLTSQLSEYDFKVEVRPVSLRRLYFVDPQTQQSRTIEVYMTKYNTDGTYEKIQILNNLEVYKTVKAFFKDNEIGVSVCPHYQCIPFYPQRKNLINSINLQELNANDEPQFLYKHSLLLVISRSKAGEYIQKIEDNIKLNRLTPYFCNQPFKSYNKKCHSTVFFFSIDKTHDEVQKSLKKEKAIENKWVLINVTTALQLPLSGDKQKSGLQGLYNQIDKNDLKSSMQKIICKLAKYPYSSSSSLCQNQFYKFTDLRSAIFTFVIMSSLGLKSFFVKESQVS